MKETAIIDSIKFSDLIIKYFNDLEEDITNLKLQKILYYLQAWHLVNLNGQLINETPEAWVNGPVYKRVYEKYSNVKREPLVSSLEDSFIKEIKDTDLTEDQADLIDSVLKVYGNFSSMNLVYKTHIELPWKEARAGLPPFEPSSNLISLDTVREYYTARVKRWKKLID